MAANGIFAGLDPAKFTTKNAPTQNFFREMFVRLIPSLMQEGNFLADMAPQRQGFLRNTLAGATPGNFAARAPMIGRQASGQARLGTRSLVARNPAFAGGADIEAANIGNQAQSGFLSNLYGPEGQDMLTQLVQRVLGMAFETPMTDYAKGITGHAAQIKGMTPKKQGLGGLGELVGMASGLGWSPLAGKP